MNTGNVGALALIATAISYFGVGSVLATVAFLTIGTMCLYVEVMSLKKMRDEHCYGGIK